MNYHEVNANLILIFLSFLLPIHQDTGDKHPDYICVYMCIAVLFAPIYIYKYR